MNTNGSEITKAKRIKTVLGNIHQILQLSWLIHQQKSILYLVIKKNVLGNSSIQLQYIYRSIGVLVTTKLSSQASTKHNTEVKAGQNNHVLTTKPS